jgi:C4-dicarboxylate-specific signal transduction histidine kinase
MTALHLPTVYFIAGILYLMMPITVWVILRSQSARSNTLWCWGGLTFGMSLFLLGMRDVWPDRWTHSVALTLLVLGALLRACALRLEANKPVHWLGIVALTLVFFVGYTLFDEVLNADQLRFLWASLAATGAFGWLAWTAREIHQRDRSLSARWIYFFYLGLSVLLALRIPNTMLGFAQPDAMTQDPLSLVLIVWTVVTAIVGNIGFLGLFIERMNREALASAQAQARQDEANRLSDQIAQLDRRRSVGEIAASLAHELSQPLTNIYLIADRMELALAQHQDTSLNQYFADLNRNTQKAGDILGRIRSFIRSRDRQYERVEIAQVINDVSALIRDLTHNESVELEVSLPPEPLAVRADPVQLSQIFMNVLRNAIQATEGQAIRQLKIRVWRDGAMAHITLTDNGPGLSALTLDHAGMPFFTTKNDGLGVGLSISKSIAHQHGGILSIGNSPSGGAVVELQLPAVD